MALSAEPEHVRSASPALAQFVLKAILPHEMAECVLGDFEEAYRAKEIRKPVSARLWYWRQVLISTSPFLQMRIQTAGPVRIGLLALTALLGYLAIIGWDIYIARGGARFVATQPDAPELLVVRSIYYALYFLGVAVAGALAAGLAFRKHRGFWTNALSGTGPIAIILLFLFMSRVIGGSTDGLLTYLTMRTAIALPALLSGAFLVVIARRRLKL